MFLFSLVSNIYIFFYVGKRLILFTTHPSHQVMAHTEKVLAVSVSPAPLFSSLNISMTYYMKYLYVLKLLLHVLQLNLRKAESKTFNLFNVSDLQRVSLIFRSIPLRLL